MKAVGSCGLTAVAAVLLSQRGLAAEPRGFVPGPAALAAREWSAPGDYDAEPERDRGDGEPAALAARRLYVTGMVGSTHGGSTPEPDGAAAAAWPANANVSGEGAVGVEIPQRVGTWRVEFEGRRFGGAVAPRPSPAPTATWSTTASAWREVPLVGDVSAYAGGGAGFAVGSGGTAGDGGGTRVGPAWQAGGGLAWAVTDRVTFDVGYRVHGAPPRPAAAPEGEVLFAVRVFEPLRGWRR